jgi:tRNA uridine 5-carbamoylmethylation protein Kti12
MKHVFVMGWPKSGKTTMLQHLETTHKRKIIRLDELVDWNKEN